MHVNTSRKAMPTNHAGLASYTPAIRTSTARVTRSPWSATRPVRRRLDRRTAAIRADRHRHRRRRLRHAPLPHRHHRPSGHPDHPDPSGPGGSGKTMALRHVPETKPSARRVITDGPSGNTGLDTTPAAGSRRRCVALRPSASASQRETPTDRPPKSKSASLS